MPDLGSSEGLFEITGLVAPAAKLKNMNTNKMNISLHKVGPKSRIFVFIVACCFSKETKVAIIFNVVNESQEFS